MRRLLFLALLSISCAQPTSDDFPAADESDPDVLLDYPHFGKGMVSITFDDGWVGQATLGSPRLVERGWKGTFYLVPGWFDSSKDGEDFVSIDQAKEIVAAGHEIGDHTMHHENLRGLSAPDVFKEMYDGAGSLDQLLEIPPESIVSFATPHGAWDKYVLDDAKLLFESHRTGKPYVNTPETDPYLLGGVLLEISNIDYPGRRPDDIAALIKKTAEEREWLVLVFHGLVDGPVIRQTDEPIEQFDRVLDEIAQSGLDVVTVHQGVTAMHAANGAGG